MRETKNRTGLVHLVSVLLIICIFAVSAMVLVNVGAIIYKNIAENNLETFQVRTSLSYVKTKINQYDGTDSVKVEEKDGRKQLVLSEAVENEIYDTIVYFYNGKLLEITHEQGAEFKPEDGFTILSVDKFEFSEEGGIVKMKATNKNGESETMFVKIRSY